MALIRWTLSAFYKVQWLHFTGEVDRPTFIIIWLTLSFLFFYPFIVTVCVCHTALKGYLTWLDLMWHFFGIPCTKITKIGSFFTELFFKSRCPIVFFETRCICQVDCVRYCAFSLFCHCARYVMLGLMIVGLRPSCDVVDCWLGLYRYVSVFILLL